LTQSSDISAQRAAQLVDDLTTLIAHACRNISAISPETVLRRVKPDQSPVTAADEASEAVILRGLARMLPDVPVVAEESAAKVRLKPAGSFIIVDPLDGTREYLAGRDEFTVNLAIVTQGVPIAGIIAAPRLGRIWRGVVGKKAERLRLLADGADQAETINTRRWPDQPVVAISRSHMDAATDVFIGALGPVTRAASGSAIKFCYVAEGSADVYPRLGTTCEWDVAAGHALVAAAGGIVTTPQGTALSYGRIAENFRVPAFVAWGDPGKAATVKVQPPSVT
jgi:3'(2'), 5'-bisphosphate nucleotidase